MTVDTSAPLNDGIVKDFCIAKNLRITENLSITVYFGIAMYFSVTPNRRMVIDLSIFVNKCATGHACTAIHTSIIRDPGISNKVMRTFNKTADRPSRHMGVIYGSSYTM